jgi:protein-disulfide isomerase
VVGALFGEDGENVTTLQVSTLVGNNTEVAALVAGAAKEQDEIAHVGSPPAAAMQAIPSTGIPSASLSAGERLIRDLSTAATVVVGNASAPELLMVMDPHCAHCQATWKALRDSIVANKLQVRMIPLTTGSPENARVAGMLLQAANPFEAFDKYANGDKTALAGEPDAVRAKAISANLDLAAKWKIFATPYLVYRAKDGRIKIVQGEPERIAAVLTDLLQ